MEDGNCSLISWFQLGVGGGAVSQIPVQHLFLCGERRCQICSFVSFYCFEIEHTEICQKKTAPCCIDYIYSCNLKRKKHVFGWCGVVMPLPVFVFSTLTCDHAILFVYVLWPVSNTDWDKWDCFQHWLRQVRLRFGTKNPNPCPHCFSLSHCRCTELEQWLVCFIA